MRALDNTTFEKHYRVGDLARLWGLGRETVRKLVKDDPGAVSYTHLDVYKRQLSDRVAQNTSLCWTARP